ncbi:hypothetical protein V6N13_076235 [Hibiscus sabdariffa]
MDGYETAKDNKEDVVNPSESVDIYENKMELVAARLAEASEGEKQPKELVMVVYKPRQLFFPLFEDADEAVVDLDTEESAKSKE